MDIEQLVRTLEQGPLSNEALAELNANNTGMDATLGIVYTSISRTGVSAEIKITPVVLQPFGIVHGGLYSAIGESIGSFAGVLAAGAPVAGISNSTNFLRPASSGTIKASSRPVHLGSSTQLWEITCKLDGKILATTSLRTMIMG